MLPVLTTRFYNLNRAARRALHPANREAHFAWMAAVLLLAASALASPIVSLDDTIDQFFAAARKGDAAAVEALLKKGVDVNAKWRYDQTALFPACDRGQIGRASCRERV